MELRSAGPYASVLDLGEAPSPDLSVRIAALHRELASHAPAEVRDLVPAFSSLLIEHRPGVSTASLRRWISAALETDGPPWKPRHRPIRVAYGDEADRDELEAALGLPFDHIVQLHQAHTATVAFLGFTPGFPYLLGLPEALSLPRRERPRSRIPAGAVAIAAGLGGIYPAASPGGWWVLGRTDQVLFDPDLGEPALLAPGDSVTFEAVTASPAPPHAPVARNRAAAIRGRPGDEAVELLEVIPGSASLQADVRAGVGHLGAAQAGALDPLARELANRLVGNPGSALALELIGQPLAAKALRERLAAVTGGGMRVLLDGREIRPWQPFRWNAGEVLELQPDRSVPGRTAIIALAGGFAGDSWRGSLSTDVRARAGGSTRWLASGDVLATAGPTVQAPREAVGRPRLAQEILLRIHPGPQFDFCAFDTLTRTTFRLADADRTGARLEGAQVEHPTPSVVSDGSPLGAVQTPPDGRPIVLLNDRGRTGGYAKPAVVDPRDLWRLAQAKQGDRVGFAYAGPGSTAVHRPEPLHSWS